MRFLSFPSLQNREINGRELIPVTQFPKIEQLFTAADCPTAVPTHLRRD
jgi:hypothetical protein